MEHPEHQTEALGQTAPRPSGAASDPVAREGQLLLERFKLVRLVGRGGMGEVYEARDLRLHTTIAVKMVRESSPAASELLDRLRREVQLARGVTHPNVCRLFDLHEGPGPEGKPIAFVTMEFLDGETLAERLQRNGPFAPRNALPLLGQMAQGLAAIHARGLVHRDFKPGNVMLVPDGPGTRAVVTDLGIARAIGTGAGSSDWAGTEAGAVVGSPAYMAPEQRRGNEVTARADIHALAQVACEMVGGKHGGREPDGVPRSWRPALRRGLDADPQRRPADPRALVAALGASATRRGLRVGAIAGATVLVLAGAFVLRQERLGRVSDRRAIAVLTLTELGERPEDPYFAEGLAEDISTQLTQVRALHVTSRSAVRSLESSRRPAQEVARELGVGTLLEGTVRRAGSRIRITTQLVDARTDRQLWAETYDRDARDVLDVQRDVASKVATALAVQLTDAEGARLGRGATRNPEAYDLYLRGIAKADELWTPRFMRAAIADLERAAAVDPGYALAHAQLGLQLIRLGLFIEPDQPSLLTRGRAEVARALALEPELATPHLALGTLLFSAQGGWDLDGAMREFRRAEELEPGSAYLDIPAVAYHVGLEELALRTLESARKLNPTSRAVRGMLVETLVYSGRWKEALDRAQDLDARIDGYTPVEAFLRVGRVAEAMQWAFAPDPEGEYLPNPPQALVALTLAVAGRKDEAAFLVGLFERGYPVERGNPAHHDMHALACAEALLGRPREAVAWLRKATQNGLPDYPLFLRDPLLDPIRSDPEFIQLMAELKGEWERRVQEYR